MRSRGFDAERRAERYLVRRGWRVIARNWRGGGGELDIVATRRGVVAIMEVKARADADALVEPISYWQRRRLLIAADTFVARRPQLDGYEVRIDLVAIHLGAPPWRAIRHDRGILVAEDYDGSSNNVKFV